MASVPTYPDEAAFYPKFYCLKNGEHTAFLKDTFGDGWGDGMLVISVIEGEGSNEKVTAVVNGKVLSSDGQNEKSYKFTVGPPAPPAPPPPLHVCPSGQISCTTTMTVKAWGTEISWDIDGSASDLGQKGYPQFATSTSSASQEHIKKFCLTAGEHTVHMKDTTSSGGHDGWHGGWLKITGKDGQVGDTHLSPPHAHATPPLGTRACSPPPTRTHTPNAVL